MRICYVGDALSIHTQRWAEEFAQRGHEVHLISKEGADLPSIQLHLLETNSARNASRPGDSAVVSWRSIVRSAVRPVAKVNDSLYRKAAQVCDYYSWVAGDLAIAGQCKEIVKAIRPDVLHGHFLTRYAFYAAYTGYKPLIVSAWGSDVFVNAKETLIDRMYCKFTIRRANIVTAESKTMEDALLRLGAPRGKIKCFSWGVDCDLFTPTLKGQAIELRARMHIPVDAPIILSNRNMKPIYNIELILRSFIHVVQEVPEAVLILLRGYGTDEYTHKICDEVNRLNLSSNVRIVNQLLDLRQMAVFLNASDVLLSIPSSDSFPISVLEGMACGTIPVLSDIEANRELIRLGGKAFIVPTLDEQTLSSKVVYCLSHLSDLTAWRESNLSYVLQNYNWQDSVKQMEAVYQKILLDKQHSGRYSQK